MAPRSRARRGARRSAFGESVGEPSRWNTLRALRVLRWYQTAGRVELGLLALSGVWRVHAERPDSAQLPPCLCRAGAHGSADPSEQR